jgi:hypothetical protein
VTDLAVDTLRLRGPGARRLGRVAATALPAALERALADVSDVQIDSVAVKLDLDPEDYDDETLAVLWADAIRSRVLEHAPRRSRRPGPGPSSAPGRASSATVRRADVVSAARAWLAAERGANGASPVPALLLKLGEPAVAARVRAGLRADEWSDLVLRLASTVVPAFPRSRPEPMPDSESTQTVTGGGVDLERPAPSSPRPDRAPPADHIQAVNVSRRMEGLVLARLEALAAVAIDDGGSFAAEAITRAAGLVLLYPWLADHCRRAEALHPALDPIDVREAALAAVVSAADESFADDSLVRFLAGRPDPLSHEPRDRVPLTHGAEVSNSAHGVLVAFTTLLPGFERSSDTFVRDSWIARLGRLDTDRDPALLTAVTHPLDVVLPLLPYPIGLVKLRWSPLLTARFR